MSVWTELQGVSERIPHWPQPFECQLREFKWWHCGEHHVVDIKTVAGCFGHFWWSEIFPSFQEFARVQVTGKARCGFGFKTKKKNPLSPLWGDSISLNRTRIVASMISPITTLYFVWWASGALMEAAAMAQTMMYAEAAGEQRENTILIPQRTSLFGLADLTGGLLTDEALCAQILEHPSNSNFIQAPEAGFWTSLIVGDIAAQDWTIDTLDIRFSSEDGILETISFANLSPGSVTPFALECANAGPVAQLRVEAEIHQHGGSGLAPTLINVERWMAEWETEPFEPFPCVDGEVLRTL